MTRFLSMEYLHDLSGLVWALPLIFQIFFAIHALRTGRGQWLWIILFFPVVGALIYFLAEFLPDLKSGQGLENFTSAITNKVVPGLNIRRLKDQLEICDSFTNREALAEGYMQLRDYCQAIEQFKKCLEIPHYSDDPHITGRLASAYFLNGNHKEAEGLLIKCKGRKSGFEPQQLQLLLAMNYEKLGKKEEAVREYEQLLPTFLGQEARCRYAMFLKNIGQSEKARLLFQELIKHVRISPAFYRREQACWVKLAQKSLASRKETNGNGKPL